MSREARRTVRITEGYQGSRRLEKGYQPTGEVPQNLKPPRLGSAAVIPQPKPKGEPARVGAGKDDKA